MVERFEGSSVVRKCWRTVFSGVSFLLECCFTSTETVGVLGTGAQDVHLDFHIPPEL